MWAERGVRLAPVKVRDMVQNKKVKEEKQTEICILKMVRRFGQRLILRRKLARKRKNGETSDELVSQIDYRM